ncbi:histidine phosphatase family protein [Sneathiella chungangensis]|uniref:Histidine phosphatase family protein n=1 Tax=Sneathiella chungangensis TaxID=1418234 RepID=A0A845MFY0_9PROT|nr:histidine phosphatase family protein [Sneathiella chungangensis]MZR22157.1 histidine phosphatase family protein [Sneathiella chungangensis]
MKQRGFVRAALAAFIGVLLLAACSSVHSPPGTETTVILLRHADRIPFKSDLNEKGIARARALPAAVADLDIDVIYSPDKKRNLDTVAPLIEERGIELRVIEVSNVAKRLVEENPGKTVMWVGNTDNLQTIYGQLGGDGRQPDKYGEIAIMQIYEDGPPKIEMRYFGPE